MARLVHSSMESLRPTVQSSMAHQERRADCHRHPSRAHSHRGALADFAIRQSALYGRRPFAKDFEGSDVTGTAAGLYPALVQRVFSLRAPMDSADSRLISASSSRLFALSRFGESRSDLFCHHSQVPAQPFDVPSSSTKLTSPTFGICSCSFMPAWRSRILPDTSGRAPGWPRWCGPSCSRVRRSRHSVVAASSSARSMDHAVLDC